MMAEITAMTMIKMTTTDDNDKNNDDGEEEDITDNDADDYNITKRDVLYSDPFSTSLESA